MTMDRIIQHLYLVGLASIFTILLGLILGVIVYLYKPIRPFILGLVDVLQTIPVLALLGVIMLIFGASSTTVIIGIVLYSLLPVVRNTYVGLSDVDPALKEAAIGMGMTKVQRLRMVELKLAFPMVFTGIRIAVVTSIGTAVFGAVVGGGGLGSVINRAILVQDMDSLLKATLVLMAMAVIFDMILGRIEQKLNEKKERITTIELTSEEII
ncbi:MAG: ABC transporter permease [Clostridiaceae bacterium]